MKLLFFILIISFCISDNLYFYDYEANEEYYWDGLQSESDNTLEFDSFTLSFNFGKPISKTCHKQEGSVIKFSKSSSSCEILGHHEFNYYTPYKALDSSGLIFFYEGGEICSSRSIEGIKRRVEFKLICSLEESSFKLANSIDDCTTILEKNTVYGCSIEYLPSLWTKILIFS